MKEKTTNVLEDFEKAKNKFNTFDYTQEEFEKLANLYTESFRDVKQGEMVKGRLVRIQDDNVIIVSADQCWEAPDHQNWTISPDI